MKFFRFLFGKFFVSLLLLLLQILIIAFFILIAGGLSVYVQILWAVVSIIVFFRIVWRKETPEYKVPWIFMVLAFPVLGVLLYVLLAHPKMKPRESAMLKRIDAQTDLFTKPIPAKQKPQIKGQYEKICGVGEYLSKTSKLDGSIDNYVKYYKVGEELWADLIEELKKAKKFIFMEYFIIEHGKMWGSIHDILVQKVKEGVEVRLLYDDVGSMSKVRNGYYRVLRKEGISCHKFNPFRPIVSGIYNNRDHRKITVIDGLVGFTGGINLGDEYINENHRLGHWKDTGLMIKGPAVANLTTMFFHLHDMTTKTVSDYKKYYPSTTPTFSDPGYVHVFGDGPKPYYPEQVGENNFINLISRARNYVYITTPYLIIDHNMAMTLRIAAQRGLDVRIITPHIPDKKFVFNMTRSNYAYLMDAGVKIYEYTPGFIHAKMLLADDNTAFVGTINLDYRSFTHHYECGAVLYKTPCIADIKKDFDQIFEVSERIPDGYKLKFLQRVFLPLLQLFAPML